MAIEAKRGCGYRKVGGTYMMGEGEWSLCDRLPYRLDVCPCCGEGYRPSRGLRIVAPDLMLSGRHTPCACGWSCLVCYPPSNFIDGGIVGHYLEWVGGAFYKNPAIFAEEAKSMGISRRLKGGIPRDIVVGKSVVYLAHRDILFTGRIVKGGISRGVFEKGAGVFSCFTVNRLEHICTESELDLVDRVSLEKEIMGAFPQEVSVRVKQLIGLKNRGVILIPVPDGDKDHR